MESPAPGGAAEAPLSRALEREHREIDDVLETCADLPVASEQTRTALGRAVVELRRHIYVEEDHLFPPLRAAGMTGPILVMLREHAEMWPILDTVDRELNEGDDDALREACRQLLVLLQRHNPKEELILYPQVDGVVGDDESHRLIELLDTGRMPEGWICHLLRPRDAAPSI